MNILVKQASEIANIAGQVPSDAFEAAAKAIAVEYLSGGGNEDAERAAEDKIEELEQSR